MNDNAAPAKMAVAGFEHVPTAPFIHFDGVACVGASNGIVQIELAANCLAPLAEGGVDIRIVEVARLRCSPMAAAALRADLEKALQMAGRSKDAPPASIGRPN